MEKKKRKLVTMDSWVRARITDSQRAILDGLLNDYGVDESEFIRRVIIHIHRKRPQLSGEILVPVKTEAQLNMTA